MKAGRDGKLHATCAGCRQRESERLRARDRIRGKDKGFVPLPPIDWSKVRRVIDERRPVTVEHE
jgi:hypothetical protein